LCQWLTQQGARVQAHDPTVKSLPVELEAAIQLQPTALAALTEAAALVVATEWPEYQAVTGETITAAMQANPIVIDANRFLSKTLSGRSDVRYAAVGAPVDTPSGESH
jgi:UDPglucose 6-dehydrogenase